MKIYTWEIPYSCVLIVSARSLKIARIKMCAYLNSHNWGVYFITWVNNNEPKVTPVNEFVDAINIPDN